MQKHWQVLAKVLSLVCMVALVVTACAPSAAPPAEVEERTVKIRVAGALTGPLASTTWGLTWGVVDYLKYVNDEGGLEYQTPRGKTDRVKIDFAWEDHAYNAARAVSIYKRQIKDDVLAYYTTASSMVETTLGMITRDRMPVVGNEMQSPLAVKTEPIFYVSESPGYISFEAAFANWVKQDWKLERPPKIGLVCLDSVTSRGQHPGGLPDYCAGIGVDFVGLEWVPFAVTDSTIELTRLAAGDVDWIYINHVVSGVNVIIKDATRMGLREKTRFCVIPYGFDTAIIKLAPEAAEGIYGQTVVALPHEDLPGVMLAKEIAGRYHPDLDSNAFYYKGMFVAMCLLQGIKTALERVGYENLSRDAIREGLMSIKNFDTGGLTPPVTVEDPSYPVFNPYIRLAAIEEGKVKAVGDWVKIPLIW